jgi:hypothetical protein
VAEIINYRGMPILLLRPVAEEWAKEAQGNAFGLETNIDLHLEDLHALANRPESILLVLVGEKGLPVGYLGLHFFKNKLGHELIAEEKYWFISPQGRGRDSLKLIREAQKIAREAGATHILFTASYLASDKHDRITALYEHMGMHPFESTYCLSLNNGDKGE